MRQRNRVAEAGLDIDRERIVRFDFDGNRYEGHAGDTLASALLANGVSVVGRSLKYHRPRGVVALGGEEPNALVRVGLGDRAVPNLKATEVPLLDGLVAESQNRWPSLGFDVGAAAGLVSRFIPAGFYYKTFMGPPWGWATWERHIRRMAGLGRAPEGRDPDRYAKRHIHCEVLVAGGGPAGLVAALAAARTGVRVVLADENAAFGGGLLQVPAEIDGKRARAWVADIVGKLERLGNVTLLPRSTVTGYYDHELLTVAERITDGVAAPDPRLPRERHWMIRARQVVLATGAIERPQVFAGNDLPRVMLTRAIRGYLHRFGVLCGRSVVLCTTDDTAYQAAVELRRAGAAVVGIVDSRDPPGEEALALARSEKIPVFAAHIPTFAHGRRRVRGLEASRLKADGREVSGLVERFACDLVGMSGGWSPAVHLFSQTGGKLRYARRLAAFVPGETRGANRSAGACTGEFDLRSCLWQGFEAGAAAASDAGAAAVSTGRADESAPDDVISDAADAPPVPWAAPSRGRKQRFVDFQNDVTADDIELAAREGYRSVEHLKRYTTLGMGTDQGRLANMHGLALLSEAVSVPIPSVGTTTFRPPYAPVTIGALAAGKVGESGRPVRQTAVHDWHEGRGGVSADWGYWKRPRCYPVEGESEADATFREVRAARSGVALTDLGSRTRIELHGIDASVLLDRLFMNDWPELPVGRARYGVMLREDGMIFDHGVAARLGRDRFLLSTAGPAETLLEHVTFLLEAVWPELRVFVTDVTESSFVAGLLGPNVPEMLAELCDDAAAPGEALVMSISEAQVAGIPARVLRSEIFGEPVTEIHVATDFAMALWSGMVTAGGPWGLEACGTAAMDVIRIERGRFALGAEADGRTTPADLGLASMVSHGKDFVGRRSLRLPAFQEAERLQLVGLMAASGGDRIPGGAQMVAADNGGRPQPALGHLTSHCTSPLLGRDIGLALVRAGRSHVGERLYASSPLVGETTPVTVVEPASLYGQGEPTNG